MVRSPIIAPRDILAAPIDADSWDRIFREVVACIYFHAEMDGDDRVAFARVLRLLAGKEELAGIGQKRAETALDQPIMRKDYLQ